MQFRRPSASAEGDFYLHPATVRCIRRPFSGSPFYFARPSVPQLIAAERATVEDRAEIVPAREKTIAEESLSIGRGRDVPRPAFWVDLPDRKRWTGSSRRWAGRHWRPHNHGESWVHPPRIRWKEPKEVDFLKTKREKSAAKETKREKSAAKETKLAYFVHVLGKVPEQTPNEAGIGVDFLDFHFGFDEAVGQKVHINALDHCQTLFVLEIREKWASSTNDERKATNLQEFDDIFQTHQVVALQFREIIPSSRTPGEVKKGMSLKIHSAEFKVAPVELVQGKKLHDSHVIEQRRLHGEGATQLRNGFHLRYQIS
jgi:hypothetical protein